MTYCFSLENVAYAVLQTKRHQNRKEKGPSVSQILKNSRHEFEITIKWFKVNSLKEWCKKISILILGNWN